MPDTAVSFIASDYRRAAVLLKFWLGNEPGGSSDLVGVNAVIKEVENERRIVGLIGALCAVVHDAAPQLDSPQARRRLEEIILQMAGFEAEDPTW